MCFKLFRFEGKQGANSCTLDCGGKLALVLCTGTRHSAGHNLSAFGNEFLQTVYVLIVNFSYLFLTENADTSSGHFFIILFRGNRRLIFFHKNTPYNFQNLERYIAVVVKRLQACPLSAVGRGGFGISVAATFRSQELYVLSYDVDTRALNALTVLVISKLY